MATCLRLKEARDYKKASKSGQPRFTNGQRPRGRECERRFAVGSPLPRLRGEEGREWPEENAGIWMTSCPRSNEAGLDSRRKRVAAPGGRDDKDHSLRPNGPNSFFKVESGSFGPLGNAIPSDVNPGRAA